MEILVGMIASSKSTYCRKRAKEGALVINDDSITNCIHSNQYSCYREELKPLYKGIENYIITFADAKDIDVIIDRPNLSPQTRSRYISIAKSLDIPDIIGIVFKVETPEIHATRRFNHDSRGHSYEYWLEAARCHYAQYKAPVLEEGFTQLVEYDFKQ